MNWEFEIGIGSVLITIGLGLALTLPPAGWPNMPAYFVHVGVVAGLTFFVYGLALVVVGRLRFLSKSESPFKCLVLWDMILTRKTVRFSMFIITLAVIFLLPALIAVRPLFAKLPPVRDHCRPAASASD